MPKTASTNKEFDNFRNLAKRLVTLPKDKVEKVKDTVPRQTNQNENTKKRK